MAEKGENKGMDKEMAREREGGKRENACKRKTEGGGRRAEGGRQRTEDGRWRTERGNEGKKRRDDTISIR